MNVQQRRRSASASRRSSQRGSIGALGVGHEVAGQHHLVDLAGADPRDRLGDDAAPSRRADSAPSAKATSPGAGRDRSRQQVTPAAAAAGRRRRWSSHQRPSRRPTTTLGHDERPPPAESSVEGERAEGDRARCRAARPRRARRRAPTTSRHHASASREPVAPRALERQRRAPADEALAAAHPRQQRGRGQASAAGGRAGVRGLERGTVRTTTGGAGRGGRALRARAGVDIAWQVYDRAAPRTSVTRGRRCDVQPRRQRVRGWAHDPRQPGQGPRDVASMFDAVAEQVRPHQRRALARPGPAVAPGGASRPSTPSRASACSTSRRARARRASRWPTAGVEVVPADFSLGMLRVGNRRRPDLAFTAADAMRLPFADDELRRRDDVVRAAQRRRRRRRPARVPAGHQARRPAASSASSASRSTGAVPQGLPRVPHARAAAGRPPGQLQPRVLRLPRRVDPGVARPGASSPRVISAARLAQVGWRNLTGGIVALHRADRDPEPGRP